MALFALKWSSAIVVLLVLSIIAPGTAAQAAGGTGASAQGAKAPQSNKIKDWFQKYDLVRKRAQMSPEEKERSTALLTQGIAASMFGSTGSAQEQAASQALLQKMVARYVKAQSEMAELPAVPETKKLAQGYSQYFKDAEGLFSDYLKIQGNLFATDASGNSIIGQMAQRKSSLEALDVANKQLDSVLRQKYGISPYPY